MFRKTTSIKSLLAQATLFTLVAVIGLWLGSWILSIPTSSASGAIPAPTFQSPIGNPQLNIVKTVDDNAPQPGDEIEYTLTYSTTNPGSQAFDVRLYDFLPDGVQFVSSNPIKFPVNGVLQFTAPSVGDVNETVTVRVRVLEGYERLYNHTLIMADHVSPDHDSLLTTVQPPPPQWLNLTKAGDTAVLVNGELIYTLRCENSSGTRVNGVTVVDVLPAGVTFNSASRTPDNVMLPVLSWSLGSLAPGESREIVITSTAPASAGAITNTALASALLREITQTVYATQVITEGAILRLNKLGSATEVEVGDELVYTLRYENTGNQTATGVVLTDTLPSHVTVTGVSTVVLPSSPPGQLVWNIGTVSSSIQGTVVFTVTVDGGWSETLYNQADIASPDSFPGHDDLYTPVRKAMLYLPVVMRNS